MVYVVEQCSPLTTGMTAIVKRKRHFVSFKLLYYNLRDFWVISRDLLIGNRTKGARHTILGKKHLIIKYSLDIM